MQKTVKPERTHWRDEALSERHRRWGVGCPAIDIDFLLLEHDYCRPAALVEYKNEHAAIQYASHPSYQALIELGSRAEVPVIACRYTSDFSTWTTTPLNGCARKFIPNRRLFNEKDWVRLLYRMRGHEVSQSVLDGIDVEI